MERTAGPALRWSRALLLGAVAFWSGLVAHVSAGGLMPGRVSLGLLLGTLVVFSAWLLGRPASTLRVVVLLVSGQTFIHGALTAMAGHRGDPPLARATVPQPVYHPVVPTGAGERRGSLYDQLYANQPRPSTQLVVPAPVQHLMADLTGPHAVMAIAHLLAAAVIGLWLAHGERVLWTVLALTRCSMRLAVHAFVSAFRAGCGVLPCPVVAPASWDAPPDVPPRVAQIGPRVTRRGPPALLAA